jgi:drug/metabolite transporter (DMT)-like permease
VRAGVELGGELGVADGPRLVGEVARRDPLKLAQLAMTRAYALTEAARLSAVTYLATVLTFLAGIVFLGERPAWTQLAGCALVVSAGLGLAVSAARRARGSASSRQRG